MRAIFGTSIALPGLAPDLVVHDRDGWLPAAVLAGGRLDLLLDAAHAQWDAPPHVAAALAWKAYTYWLTLPAVLGWVTCRRVPLLAGPDVLMRFDRRSLITLGLREDIPVAVLPGDPLAQSGRAGVRVVADEPALLAELRRSLLDEHLNPLLTAITGRVRLSRRPLLGSLAAAVAYGVIRSAGSAPGEPATTIDRLLGALGVEGLIELVPGRSGLAQIRRRTCCLAFALPEPRVCTDCCLPAAS